MSEIALVPVHELRAGLALTPSLAWWVCAVEDGADLPDTLPADVTAEAKRQSLLADRLMTPVPQKVLAPWLALIASHYAAARPNWGGATPEERQKEASTWARTIELAMTGIPVGVFTRANLGEILLRCSFLPTAAQLMEVLAPDRDTLERRANALRRVAGAVR